MSTYIHSDVLCIGGLEFRFPEPVSWPEEGPLSCYTDFLNRPSVPVGNADIINVSMHKGIPAIAEEQRVLMNSGDGIVWLKSNDARIVQKVVPHILPGPLWEIRMHLDDSEAELYFSEAYLETEESDGSWPVGAPRYQIDQHMAMHFLASRNGVLVHSAGVCYQGKGFMCSGVSTAGKTTISRLLINHGRFDILTDDRVVLRCSNDGITMHGTPWTGEGQYATSGTAPLEAIFFLKQDEKVRVEKLSVKDTLARLMPVTSIPWFDEEIMSSVLQTLEKIAEKIPAYDLHFTKTAETSEFIADML